jgi:hypothetical protein
MLALSTPTEVPIFELFTGVLRESCINVVSLQDGKQYITSLLSDLISLMSILSVHDANADTIIIKNNIFFITQIKILSYNLQTE